MKLLRVYLAKPTLMALLFLVLVAATSAQDAEDRRYWSSIEHQADSSAKESFGKIPLEKDAKKAFDKFVPEGIRRLRKDGADAKQVDQALKDLAIFSAKLRERAERDHGTVITLKTSKIKGRNGAFILSAEAE